MEQLEQIADGVFVNSTTRGISVKPTEIAYGRYFMPSTLGHSEYEDVGARLVELARKQGQWVGITYQTLGNHLDVELEKMYEYHKKRITEMDKLREGLLTQLTRVYKGVMSLFFGKQPVEEPIRPEPKVGRPKMPHSVLTFKLFVHGPHGPSVIGSEIRGMADEGYLALVEQGNETILVPTQKFAETVYKAQQAQRRRA